MTKSGHSQIHQNLISQPSGLLISKPPVSDLVLSTGNRPEISMSVGEEHMSKLTIVIVAGAVLSGCAGTRLDVSTGKKTAVIDGGPCSVYGPLAVGTGDYEATSYSSATNTYLYAIGVKSADSLAGVSDRGSFTERRARLRAAQVRTADVLVVDAGPVKILGSCVHFSIPKEYLTLTLFRFDAKAGHSYVFSKRGSDCLQLLDTTADEQQIACEMEVYGGYVDYSSGANTALIHKGDGNFFYCNLNKAGSPAARIGLLEVDAGPFMVEATCNVGVYPIPRLRKSRFDFVAEPGHTYTFKKSKMKCIRLVDITSVETDVACEPYKKAK